MFVVCCGSVVTVIRCSRSRCSDSPAAALCLCCGELQFQVKTTRTHSAVTHEQGSLSRLQDTLANIDKSNEKYLEREVFDHYIEENQKLYIKVVIINSRTLFSRHGLAEFCEAQESSRIWNNVDNILMTNDGRHGNIVIHSHSHVTTDTCPQVPRDGGCADPLPLRPRLCLAVHPSRLRQGAGLSGAACQVQAP